MMTSKKKKTGNDAESDRQAKTTARKNISLSSEDLRALEDLSPEEMRRMIHELRMHEQSYRSQFANNAAVMLLIDYTDGSIIDANNAALQFYGYPRDRLLSMRITDINTWPATETHRAWMSVSPDHGKRFEFQHRLADGSLRQVEVSSSQVLLGERRVLHSIITDITERKRADIALRESEERYQRITKAITDYIYTVRVVDGAVVETTHGEGCLIVTGYGPNEFADDPLLWIRMVVVEDRAKVEKQAQQILAGGDPLPIEHRIVLKNKTIRWVRNTFIPYRDGHGTLIAYDGLIHDITERKQAEEALRKTSLYARNLIETSLDPLVTISAEGKITDVNVATEKITGVNRERLIGTDFADYFTEPEKARAGYQKVFEQGQVTDYPLAVRHNSGVIIEVLYNASVYRDEQGDVIGVFAAARDITERKQAEEALHRISRYARNLIETSLDPLVTISPEGQITDVNIAMEKITGVNRDQLIGTDFDKYFTEPERARVGYQEVFEQGQIKDYPLAVRHISGAITDVLYNASVYLDDQGEVLGIFAAARDITERKQAEEALQKALDQIKTLRGIVPICMICKKIRDDQGYWNQVEVYVHDHTEAEFSHGLCPECAERLYPENGDDVEGGSRPHFNEGTQ